MLRKMARKPPVIDQYTPISLRRVEVRFHFTVTRFTKRAPQSRFWPPPRERWTSHAWVRPSVSCCHTPSARVYTIFLYASMAQGYLVPGRKTPILDVPCS